jgi:hypothetical protein
MQNQAYEEATAGPTSAAQKTTVPTRTTSRLPARATASGARRVPSTVATAITKSANPTRPSPIPSPCLSAGSRAEKLPQTAAWTAKAVATPMRARRSLSGTRGR